MWRRTTSRLIVWMASVPRTAVGFPVSNKGIHEHRKLPHVAIVGQPVLLWSAKAEYLGEAGACSRDRAGLPNPSAKVMCNQRAKRGRCGARPQLPKMFRPPRMTGNPDTTLRHLAGVVTVGVRRRAVGAGQKPSPPSRRRWKLPITAPAPWSGWWDTAQAAEVGGGGPLPAT